MRRLASTIVGLLALATAPLAVAAPLPPPTTVLPWGDLPGEPGLRPGAEERPPVGPVAIAADDTRVVISDPANGQLLVLDRDGRVADAWPIDFAAVDLALLPDGAVLALDASGERVVVRDASGSWRALPLPGHQSAPLAALAVGPDGAPWVVDALGNAHALTGPAATSDHATPLGIGARLHAAGRRIDARHGEVMVWSWDRPATVRGAGPDLTLPVAADGRLLGTVRPLRADDRDVLHVLVERLTPGAAVAVEVAIERFAARDGRLLGRTAWDVANIAPINHPAAVTPSGALVVMAALPEGLAVWHLAPVDAGGSR